MSRQKGQRGPFHFDEKDNQILRSLSENARTKIAQIAGEVELSVTATKARIKKLERDGIIERYTIIINPRRTASRIKYILIELESTVEAVKRAIEKYCSTRAEVVSIELVEGHYDFILLVHEYNHDEHVDLIQNLGEIAGIKRTTTISVIEKVPLQRKAVRP
jgi:DNA-binding Lrp family transcriptional regulator